MPHKDPEIRRAYFKKRREENPGANYAAVKAWRKKNPEKVSAQNRRRHIRRREHIKKQQKAWKLRNIERVRKLDAALHRAARQADPEAERRRIQRMKDRRIERQEQVAGRSRPNHCELCDDAVEPVFDHCHASQKFRGWICHRCNRVLGSVKDSPELLSKMIKYLQEH